MATIKQQAKSKTNQVTVVVGGILAMLPAFGIELPNEVAVGVMAITAYVMRFFTKESLEDK